MSLLSYLPTKKNSPTRSRRTGTLTHLAFESLEDRTLLSGTMIGLGDLPGGNTNSGARAISADGTTVVGTGRSSHGIEAFQWTADSGMQGLGVFPGQHDESNAYGISADGAVIVGRSTSSNGGTIGAEAYRWTAQSGFSILAGLSSSSSANAVSADGSVIVGYGQSANGREAFRWTAATGMIGLGDLSGGDFFSVANAVSADGSVVVGNSQSANGNEAFRWTAETGMVGLGDLPGGNFQSLAYGISGDGSVIVGQSQSANGREAFRWTAETGMVDLGDLPGGDFQSFAYGISVDGSVIVGASKSANGTEAFRWTAETGMVALGDLAGGSFYSEAWDVSADGSVIVGTGNSDSGYEAFIWTADGTGGGQPEISVGDNSNLTDDAKITFTTPLSQYRSGASDSQWVRPGFADAVHYIDVTNSGDAPLKLAEIQIAAPDVSLDISLTANPADDITLAAGQTQRFQLTYAPTLPSLTNPNSHDFSIAAGLTIISDASNATSLPIMLTGKSTFASDISYDGSVNFGDLGIFNSNFGLNSNSANWDPTSDMNGDGGIDFGDLGLFNAQFGSILDSENTLIAEVTGTKSVAATNTATVENPTNNYVAAIIENEDTLLAETDNTLATDAAKLIAPEEDIIPALYEEPPTTNEYEAVFEQLGGGSQEDSIADLFEFNSPLADDLALV